VEPRYQRRADKYRCSLFDSSYQVERIEGDEKRIGVNNRQQKDHSPWRHTTTNNTNNNTSTTTARR
jgi:hypothetical protein